MINLVILLFVENFSISGEKSIPIVMFLDEGYLHPVIVSLTSLFENQDSKTFYHVSVLIPGNFKMESKMKIGFLKEKYGNCKIDFIDMGSKHMDMNRSHFPPITYYRLDIASVLLHEKKCIVIEGDQIIRHDLSEMYTISVDDYYFAGVCHSRSKEFVRALEIPDADNYANVGVMIMNLEKIREDKLEEKFRNVIKKRDKVIQKWHADQDVFNIVCYGKILCLPHKFGYLINLRKYLKGHGRKNEIEDPVIVHFASTPKPWKNPQKTVFHKEFWAYAAKTNLYEEEIRRFKVSVSAKSKKNGRTVNKRFLERTKKKRKKK